MKLKLDENLGRRARQLLVAAGHDVATVHEERLGSASDDEVIQVSRREERCLVTLDLEFGNPLRYRPTRTRSVRAWSLSSIPPSRGMDEKMTSKDTTAAGPHTL